MKYREYKKGYSALRRIINDDELEFSRQFVKFDFSFSERYQNDREIKGIWNARTNNVVAFINRNGNVFVRPASIYTEHLLGSKNKVIKHNNLRGLRNKVGGNVRKFGMLNMYAEKAVDRLLANGDKQGKVQLFELAPGQDIDEGFITRRIKDLLKGRELPNTLFALDEKSLTVEQRPERDSSRIYLNIEDYAEAIAQKERLERIKREIAGAFVQNVREIARQSIISRSAMNPLQFTYEADGEETVTGRIMLDRLGMRYPPEMPIEDWLNAPDIMRFILFEERVGSLAERGIDEMARREEVDRQQEATYRVYRYAQDAYRAGYAGRSIVVPSISYSEYIVSEAWDALNVELPSVEITREQIEEMNNLVAQEYPATP